MLRKLVPALTLLQFVTQSLTASAQVNFPVPSSPPKKSPTFEEMTERQKCQEELGMNGITHSGDILDVQDLTAQLLGEGFTKEEIKEIYKKNSCNSDAVDLTEPTKKSELNPFAGATLRFDQKPEDLENACKLQTTLSDGEGCHASREMQKAIQKGDFTSKDLQTLKHAADANKSYGAIIVGAAGVIVGAMNVYLQWRGVKLEEKKYEDQKAEKANQPSNTSTQNNTQPSSSSPQSSTQDHPKDTTPQHEPDPQTHELEHTDMGNATVIEDHETPKNPVVHENEEQTNLEWQAFVNGVKKSNEQCDLQKKSKSTGVPLSVLQDPSRIHTNTQGEVKNISCNPTLLKQALGKHRADRTQCRGNFADCASSEERRSQKNHQKIAHLQEKYQKCLQSQGGVTLEQRNQCEEITKQISEVIGIPLENPMESILNTVKNLKPKPTPSRFTLPGGKP